jgi:hypothetical protein
MEIHKYNTQAAMVVECSGEKWSQRLEAVMAAWDDGKGAAVSRGGGDGEVMMTSGGQGQRWGERGRLLMTDEREKNLS